MAKLQPLIVPLLSCLHLTFTNLTGTSFQDQKKERMIEDLEIIKHTLEVGYAPLDWKKSYFEWDLEKEFKKAKDLILSNPQLTVKEFQIIVRNFLNTTKDYHVSIAFYSTESATLPFSVKSASGRYFIDWVDTQQLPVSIYGIRTGDELVSIDERPIAEVVEELKKEGNKNSNFQTDQALAEISLTRRQGWSGDLVPKGPVAITTRPRNKKNLITHQLFWKYQRECISSPWDFLKSLNFLCKTKGNEIKNPKLLMISLAHQNMLGKATRDGELGARKSFLPPLGEKIWEFDEYTSGRDIPWYAYIYEMPEGHRIGYIRIPHYVCGRADVKEFGELMEFLEQETDALVIDQLNNFGGYVHVQYELASMLTSYPLKTPKHYLKLTQADIMEAFIYLDLIASIQSEIEAGASINRGEGEDDEIIDYQRLLFLKDYFEFIIREWGAGRFLTNATHLEATDWINPSSRPYTKTILMLINELDFSGGDFVPVILRDSKRLRLFGSRTAGAGGYVLSSHFANDNGIKGFSYTGSLAERMNGEKIENLGVNPDIEYSITVNDLQNNYQDYVFAVNKTLSKMLSEQK